MVTQQILQTATGNDVEKRFEDILIMYAAGIMSRMDKDYIKSVGWIHRAEQAAFQLGMESCQSEKTLSFGVPRLDKSYGKGWVKAQQECKLFSLDGDKINPQIMPSTTSKSASLALASSESSLPKSA